MPGPASREARFLAPPTRRLLALARPILVVQVGMLAFGAVDVLMVGHYSREALAAVSLGHSYTNGLFIFGMAALFVLDPLVAQAWGKGDARGVVRALGGGLTLALCLVPLLALAVAACRPILHLCARDPGIVPDAYRYALVAAAGLPAFLVFVCLRQTLQALGRLRPLVAAIVIANGLNVLFNLGFVWGRFGLPEWGAVGSAVASSLSRLALLVALVFFARPVLGPLLSKGRRQGRALLRRPDGWMLRKGAQIGLQVSLEVWIFTAVSLGAAAFGNPSLGGHAIALNLASLSYMVPLSLGQAAAALVGHAVGRNAAAEAADLARRTLRLGAAVMGVSALLFVTAPSALAGLYSRDPSVLAVASALLPVAGLFQVFDGTQTVACGLLRGAGITRSPLAANALGYWIVGFPLGWWLAFRTGLGVRGLWWGLTAGLAASALLLLLVVRRVFLDTRRKHPKAVAARAARGGET